MDNVTSRKIEELTKQGMTLIGGVLQAADGRVAIIANGRVVWKDRPAWLRTMLYDLAPAPAPEAKAVVKKAKRKT